VYYISEAFWADVFRTQKSKDVTLFLLDRGLSEQICPPDRGSGMLLSWR
jgi:hypothetical protein